MPENSPEELSRMVSTWPLKVTCIALAAAGRLASWMTLSMSSEVRIQVPPLHAGVHIEHRADVQLGSHQRHDSDGRRRTCSSATAHRRSCPATIARSIGNVCRSCDEAKRYVGCCTTNG